MKGGKYPRKYAVRGSASRRSAVRFLEVNFQSATPEQRKEWFGTTDYPTFKQTLRNLHARSYCDLDARQELDDMVVRVVGDHMLKLTMIEKKED